MLIVISQITRVLVVFRTFIITSNDKLGTVSSIRTPYVKMVHGKKNVRKVILFERKSVR